jgi:DNA-binding NarL/FixJ family response regulator
VFLIGRQWLFTEPIATLLSASPGIDLAGSTTNPADVIDALRAQAIDILLIDANLDQGDAAPLTRRIRAEKPCIKLIVFGLDPSDEVILEFIEAGANGCISHESSFQDLVRLIGQVYEGHTTCSPRTAALVFERITKLSRQNGDHSQTREVALTPREQEILQLIAAGLSNKEIAQHLKIPSSPLRITSITCSRNCR